MYSIDLDDRANSLQTYPSTEELTALPRLQSVLPATDEGYRAWLCLAGCFIASVLVWGFALSFGILQEYYSSHEPFASQRSGIPAIGTTATGLMYILLPLYFVAFQRWPRWRSWSTWASMPLLTGALIGASFASTVTQLVLSQGVLFALAGNALVAPTIIYLDEWFVKRKGLAIGIMWAGDGTGGVLMPLLLQPLLSRYGFRWTLRAVAGIIALITTPMLAFLKPRLPIDSTPVSRPVDMTFVKSRLFWTLQAFNIVQALGYFLPTNYLPSIAEALGASSSIGSLTVLVVNLASIVGCVTMGVLVDRFEITNILLCVSLASSLVVFLGLGFSITIAPLFVFCMLYGLTAGSYSTAWGGIVKDVQQSLASGDASIMFGFLAAGRGIGSVVSGPLSTALLMHSDTLHEGASSAYTGPYAPVIILSGCTAIVGGFGWIFRKFGLI